MTDDRLQGWTMVFDLDGTLVDTAPDLHKALNHCLEHAGFKSVSYPAISDLIGRGAKAMIRQALAVQSSSLTEAEIEPLWSRFLDYYQQHICELSTPFEGVTDALSRLRQAGAICAICTNKTQALSEQLIGELGMGAHFAAIVGADAVEAKKPDGGHIIQTIARSGGDIKRAIMIGDSQTDERAARNAGLPFIFVSFGYGPSPDLNDPAITTAHTYLDVAAAIDEITSRPLRRSLH